MNITSLAMYRKTFSSLSFLSLLLLGLSLAACSENEDIVEEYPDWENTNTVYFSELYSTTEARIAAGDSLTWKIIRSWSLPEDDEYYRGEPETNIIVEVLEEGTGSGCPIYSDNVWVHYRGRLLPSVSYPSGYVFDQSYYGEFNEQTASPVEFSVNTLVDGFATALQKMHIGDYWCVYIPYQLGYGTVESSTVPAYSTLIFEIRLVAYAHSGVDLPVTW